VRPSTLAVLAFLLRHRSSPLDHTVGEIAVWLDMNPGTVRGALSELRRTSPVDVLLWPGPGRTCRATGHRAAYAVRLARKRLGPSSEYTAFLHRLGAGGPGPSLTRTTGAPHYIPILGDP